VPDLERATTELLQRLIQFDTVNPPGNEEPAQLFLKAMLEGAGFECELHAAVEGRPNLIARLRAPSDGPTLCLAGHVDTVPADPDDWTADPWSGELRDGYVWGRGALDMKSQVAAEIAAAVALASEGWRPEAGELLIVVTVDEEVNGHGAEWLCTERPDLVRCDLLVNEGAGDVFDYDGSRVYSVAVAEKGVCRFDIVTHGRAGHASTPRIGDNALTKMAPVLAALRDATPALELSPEPEALMRAMGLPSDDLEAALAEVESKDPRLLTMLEPMLGVTLSPTMISASTAINVIPARARLTVDCRLPPGQGEEAARERVAAAVGQDGFDVVFSDTVVGNRSPADTPLMGHIRDFIEREDPGAEVAPIVVTGFTDSRWWRHAFPDCVAYGFFPQRTMDMFETAPLVHSADERISVDDLGLAASFYAELAEKVLR
jgi:acetylornithine deacetylase/succinyl-diaminopimelate desuccinylase-like protein